MEITPNELRDCEIPTAFRGYDQNDVHELLDRAADTIELLQQRVRQLSVAAAEAPAQPAPIVAGEGTTAAAARTLELAQRVADETVDEAKTTADTIVADGEARRDELIAAAQAEVTRIETEERARIEREIAALGARRADLENVVGDLETFERGYRDRLLVLIRGDLDRFEARAVPDGSGPAFDATFVGTERAVPTSTDSIAAAAWSAVDSQSDDASNDHAAGNDATSTDAEHPTFALGADDAPNASPGVSYDAGLFDDVDDLGASQPQAEAGDTTNAVTASDDRSTGRDSGDDGGERTTEMRSIDASAESIRSPLVGSAAEPVAASAPAPPAPPTIDLLHEQAAERVALHAAAPADDDDFFASLREATSEAAAEAPGEDRVFESDDERDSSFRDVFRRRR